MVSITVAQLQVSADSTVRSQIYAESTSSLYGPTVVLQGSHKWYIASNKSSNRIHYSSMTMMAMVTFILIQRGMSVLEKRIQVISWNYRLTLQENQPQTHGQSFLTHV